MSTTIASTGFGIDFAGKVVVVSGGNRGLGLGLTEALAKAGASVAILYHSSKDAPDVAAKLSEKYVVKIKAYQCDVGDGDLTKRVFKTIESELGEITGLIANAGICIVKPALEMTDADFDKQFGVNVLGVFHTAVAAAALWTERKQKGSIVVVSSMSSQIVNWPLTQCFYNSSKAAVSNLGKCLAAEWASSNIRVNMLSPGFINTEQTSSNSIELRTNQAKQVPLARFSEPSEHAGQALLLLSDHATYMTGGEYFVDGGYLIW